VAEPIVIEGHRAVVVQFPLRGEWIAVNTPGHTIPSHGTNFFAQRYAYDFNKTDGDGNPFPSSRALRFLVGKLSVEECHAWAQPVFAPVSGVVCDARDGWPDRTRINFVQNYLMTRLMPPRIRDEDFRPLTGNYVILGNGATFILLAHLRCGSLKVQTGQTVLVGDLIGEVGNSGNSMAPHLHIQAMDDSDPRVAKANPCSFTDLEYLNDTAWEPLVNGIPGRFQRVRVLHS
jgi:hypothetical protein